MTDETAPGAQHKLYAGDVAAMLGWTSANTINLVRMRTRRGTARVPFPDPDGYEPVGQQVNRLVDRPWWRESTIAAYLAARKEGTTRVTPEMAARMRRMRVDGAAYEVIAVAVGVSKATVARHLTTTPKG